MEGRARAFGAAVSVVGFSIAASAQQPPDVVQSDQYSSTAMGAGALALSQSASDNTAAGAGSLSSLTTGSGNTAIGTQALNGMQTGINNTAIGFGAAGDTFGSGSDNVAVGFSAFRRGGSASGNTAVGAGALTGSETSNSVGNYNTALGFGTLTNANSSATYNTAVGSQALGSISSGSNNNAIGYDALGRTTTAIDNNALGNLSLGNNTTGNFNTAIGDATLANNSVGVSNTALGRYALHSNTSGSYNVGLGVNAGYNLTTGSYNIDLSNQGVAGESGVIRIGAPGTQTAAYIAGISTTHLTGAAVYVNSNGQLGVLASSERYKTAIAAIPDSADKLGQLRPVTFHLKNEPKGELQYGLIAEEVAKVYPALVIHDGDGNIQGVRYDELGPIMLKELQEQRRALALQSAQINALMHEFAALKQQNAAAQAQLAQFRPAQ